jgi:hypothetical protein
MSIAKFYRDNGIDITDPTCNSYDDWIDSAPLTPETSSAQDTQKGTGTILPGRQPHRGPLNESELDYMAKTRG